MKVWVLVTMPFSGGKKKLIRGFDTEAEARRIAAIIDECDPRYALDIEEIEVDCRPPRLDITWPEPPNYFPGWVMSGADLFGNSSASVPQSPAANFAPDEKPSGPVSYEEPMPHMENFR